MGVRNAASPHVEIPSDGDQESFARRFRYGWNYDLTYTDFCALKGMLEADEGFLSDLPPFRVAILRNITIEPLLPVLAGEVVKAGYKPEFYVGDFDAIAANVMNPTSEFYRFEPDVIVLAQWLEAVHPALSNRFLSLPTDAVEAAIEDICGAQREFLANIRRYTSAPVLVNNHPLPISTTLGILDAQRTNGQTSTVLRLNASLLENCREFSDVFVVDLMRAIANVGGFNSLDERYWHIGRAPFNQPTLLALGAEYGRFFTALRGRSRKCLVLDCDNTLWGGVIGEDGIGGIQIGTTYPGSCYRALQEEIINLHDRGVLIALCSKNNEEDVLDVLRNHPDMLIREQHLAITMVNWNDKVTNLRQIATDLNIGLDSLVFLDDNPFECNYVREHLPEVAVIELSRNPSSFRSRLARCGLFDSLAFSDEDKKRTHLYQVHRKRVLMQSSASSLFDYLHSLGMRAEIRAPNEIELARVAQLTQKTNQFTLTTRRYSEGQIAEMLRSDTAEILRLSAHDNVSELGLVGVAIVRYEGALALVDSFLMSCRALGRGMEEALLSKVVEAARARGASDIIGTYIPSAKNAQCESFYERNGFRKVMAGAQELRWELAPEDPAPAFPSWIGQV